MKKLLGLSAADIIWSILPIVFWYLTGILWGKGYTNWFILSYSIQFIRAILQETLIRGSLKSWISEEKKVNYAGAGFACYMALGFAFSIGVSALDKNILSIMGYRDALSQSIFKICVYQSFIDAAVMGVNWYFQYDGKRKAARILSYLWTTFRIGSLFLCYLLFRHDGLTALRIMTAVMFILCLSIMIKYIDFQNMKSNFLNWMNREAYNISSHFVMFIIYMLGIKNMTGNLAFLTAYNISTECSDIFWDMECSIDTYTATEAVENWKKKKQRILKDTVVYSAALLMISFILVLLSGNRLALSIWLIEMSLYVPDCIGCYFLAYLSVIRPSKWMYILGFGNTIVRLFVQIIITSLYGIPISCFAGSLTFVIGSFILYYKNNRCNNKIGEET